MYNVTLIHLAPGVAAAASEWERIECPNVSEAEMQSLLQRFCDVDPVENATADPEIRVQVRAESYFIRTGQKKLILYDALNREIPGQTLTVGEVMAELDGTAIAARTAIPFLFSERRAEEDPALVAVAPLARRSVNRPRMIALGAAVCVLTAAHAWLWFAARADDAAKGFAPLDAADVAMLQGSLTGVYLTGTQPGQHGIALTDTGELRLFELRGIEAPGLVQARFKWGQVGGGVCLATDQPGGLILLPDRDTMVYCRETYKRVP